MSTKTHHPEKKGGFPLFKLALGAALAAGAGYYVTHKEKVDKEAKKKIDILAKLFKEKRPAVEKRVKDIWGKVSTDGIATYMDLRGQLLHALESENLKKGGKVLKSHYEKIVEDIIGKARKSGVLTPEVEKKLAKVLKMDWTQVSAVLADLLATGAKKTVAAIKKTKAGGKAGTGAGVKKTGATAKKAEGKAGAATTTKKAAAKSVKKSGAKKATPAKKAKAKKSMKNNGGGGQGFS
jgi:hypothetical protein